MIETDHHHDINIDIDFLSVGMVMIRWFVLYLHCIENITHMIVSE